ncbi:ABC transporter permease [Chitinimonas sp. BJYL2]|uniref:ABC transporter permease n=1 Tax=Chitinimonas sp. BJYL2 TaxID=2976696 RepID=UPI0022B56BB7|nr:ABC transporter permease [Chitinimonas sp. BJYL2]
MMPFSTRVALRYLWSSPLQTALLLAGVGVAVLAFVFITSLINGLATTLTRQTIGNIAHITLEREPAGIRADWTEPGSTATQLLAEQVLELERPQIREWTALSARLDALPGVIGTSPEVTGAGFVRRSGASSPVSYIGVLPERASLIADLAGTLQEGKATLSVGEVLIGRDLANKLRLRPGSVLTLRGDNDTAVRLRIAGIFKLGISSVDERIVYLHLRNARVLAGLDNGISRIQLKLADPAAAPVLAAQLRRETGLKVYDWTEKNTQLKQALTAQGNTGRMIQTFSLLTMLLVIASSLLLSTQKRKAEIGIMRSAGVPRRFVFSVFLQQGIWIGWLGGVSGALVGWGFSSFLATLKRADGTQALPIDPQQGGYLIVISAAVVIGALAATLPAWRAAKLDPLEAIGT